MIVTVNTDASFIHEHKRGSYAFWIVCNDFKILKSGVLKTKVTRPEVAEGMCIINALHILSIHDLSKVTRVIVNTDCQNAIYVLTNNKRNINRYGLTQMKGQLLDKYFSVVNKLGINHKIEFRYVKAHNGAHDARSYVNEWCDAQAKSQIRKLREQLNSN